MPMVTLDRRESFRLRDAVGVRVVCRAGTLWITQHHDTRDIVLRAGESFLLDHRGVAIVHAAERSQVLFEEGKLAAVVLNRPTPCLHGLLMETEQ